MKKAKTNQETWVSLNYLANQSQLSRKTLGYHAVKLRLRTFKWHGVRYVELSHAKCLLEARKISTREIEEILSQYC